MFKTFNPQKVHFLFLTQMIILTDQGKFCLNLTNLLMIKESFLSFLRLLMTKRDIMFLALFKFDSINF